VEGSLQSIELRCEIEPAPVLPVGRRLGVHALDGAVGRVDDASQFGADARPPGRRAMGGSREQSIALVQQRPDRLVRFDPRRGRAGITQHPMGHRPLSGRRVVVERQARTLVRQVVERSVLHRLTDLPLDERLADGFARWPVWVRQLRIALGGAHGTRIPCPDRQAVASSVYRCRVQLIDGRPVFAATDLVAYLACEHLTQLERAALARLVQRPMRDDPELDIIRKRGFQHEARYLADLEADGRSTIKIDLDGSIEDRGDQLRSAAADTIDAMAAGADVIYQATFFDGTWRGHADFLLRVDDPERPSIWGPYHYEVADTKLARHVKASAVLQICSYIDQLERIQGVRPEWLHVALGGSARAVETLRVDDYMAYYRSARDRFLATMADATPATYPPAGTYPEPVEHCDVCRWAAECVQRRRDDDHLSLVAGISGRQRQALTGRDVRTLEALGDLPLPMDPKLEGTSAGALQRVREQARMQLEGRRTGTNRYEFLLPEPGQAIDPERGLATLPSPSRGDLFLDLEGDPFAFDDGLDYLFGIMETDGTFHAFWSRDEAGEFSLDGERRAFEALMDFIDDRLRADPDLHIYHYAPYEPTALKRLMGRYGTREAEVDDLLRRGVLVDLLRAVRQSLRASVESYSIKKMEVFYGFSREIDLRDAGSSIVAFEQWLELGEGERPAADHLEQIEKYNRDDVVSTLRLRDWLESLREELARETGLDVPRPGPRGEPPERLSDDLALTQALVERLADPAVIPADPAERTSEQAGQWLLAQLLGWHRREDKATWWEFFRLMGLTSDQLIDESDPIGGLEASGAAPRTTARPDRALAPRGSCLRAA